MSKLQIRVLFRVLRLACQFIYANSVPHRLDLAAEAKFVEGMIQSELEEIG